jgi:hypothetical protein
MARRAGDIVASDSGYGVNVPRRQRHSPAKFTPWPATAASQALEYVCPLQAQTGR